MHGSSGGSAVLIIRRVSEQVNAEEGHRSQLDDGTYLSHTALPAGASDRGVPLFADWLGSGHSSAVTARVTSGEARLIGSVNGSGVRGISHLTDTPCRVGRVRVHGGGTCSACASSGARLIDGALGSGGQDINCLSKALGGSACRAGRANMHGGGVRPARAAGSGARLIGGADGGVGQGIRRRNRALGGSAWLPSRLCKRARWRRPPGSRS